MQDLFKSKIGKRIYDSALLAIERYSMADAIKRGVLVGLSGGADSVMLLLVLLEYRRRVADFPIIAVHINHGIRGDEAKRDEEFSKALSRELDVEFLSVFIDVPKMAKDSGIGIEEAARNARYSEFGKIISGRSDISTICVAHNATDNLETVILNMLRGSSLKGIAGIPPIRDNIIRPLLLSPKEDITSALIENDISFVTDSTNFSSDYSRNYIRNEIIPKLSRISESPEKAVSRLSFLLRRDSEYLDTEAMDFLRLNREESGIRASLLAQLHPSLFTRVIVALSKEQCASPELVHIEKCRAFITSNKSFSVDIPGDCRIISDGAYLCVKNKEATEEKTYGEIMLHLGENPLPGGRAAILISKDKNDIFSSNVYKISIQERFKFDIINRRIVARSKKNADEYVARGMTRSLKKLYCDKKLSEDMKKTLPVIVSDNEILWVPGFDVADSARPAENERVIYITYAEAEA